jgi:transcriptional regulator with XRE-family HTH domain
MCKSVAENVRAELARQKLTQTDLAGWLGLSRTSIYRRLNGHTDFRTNELQVVARHLGVDVTVFYRVAS